jgi:hypothetical protein
VQLIVDIARRGVQWGMGPLDHLPPELALAIVGVATGLLVLVLVRWFSPQRFVALARARMAACIYEMRLFLDSPRRVLAAQCRLVAWSVLYLVSLLPPLLISAPLLVLMYSGMEVRYGLAPVAVDRALVVRYGLADGVDGRTFEIHADGPLEITAPVLHAPDESALYVRVRVRAPGRHRLVAILGSERWEKRVDAADAPSGVSTARRSGIAAWWALGDEPSLDGDVRSIELVHPPRHQSWFGTTLPWWIHWLGVATVVAFGLRRRLGVEL